VSSEPGAGHTALKGMKDKPAALVGGYFAFLFSLSIEVDTLRKKDAAAVKIRGNDLSSWVLSQPSIKKQAVYSQMVRFSEQGTLFTEN
jgi:hypothetical protein